MSKIQLSPRADRLPAHPAADGAGATGRPSAAGFLRTCERVAEALQSPRFILFYLGFYAGCMATVGLALIWSRVAS